MYVIRHDAVGMQIVVVAGGSLGQMMKHAVAYGAVAENFPGPIGANRHEIGAAAAIVVRGEAQVFAVVRHARMLAYVGAM